MYYQSILTGISPYFAKVAYLGAFREHRHADIELHYCIKGGFSAVINKRSYFVGEGELLLVSPMSAHSFPGDEAESSLVLTIIVGVSFLKNFFSYFSAAPKDRYIISPDDTSTVSGNLFSSLKEMCELCARGEDRRELLVRGNICKICSHLIDSIATPDSSDTTEGREIKKVANIEKALEMIYHDYQSPLTVDDAAAVTGYGKSNFCKIFKSITGETFHNVLNRQRVESACALLEQTGLSISEIASEVGFGESKTFCRVFKSVTSYTPLEYRKEHK